MGYHTGSMTAVELAHQYPRLVHRVVMTSAPLYTPEEQAVRRARNKPEAYAEDGSHLVERWRFGRTFYGEDVPLDVSTPAITPRAAAAGRAPIGGTG